jgi:hypothetical protein
MQALQQRVFSCGTVVRKTSHKGYDLQRCRACDFVFVSNPDTNYNDFYNVDYYKGNGPDPLVDYAFDIAVGDASVKMYETRGLELAALSTRRLLAASDGVSWLDFECRHRFSRQVPVGAVGGVWI